MVALAAASSMPDVKADPTALNAANISNSSSVDAAARQANADRVTRSVDRTTDSLDAMDQSIPDLWVLPAKNYTIAPSSGAQAGVDLTAAEGTPFYAAHDATVKLARWCGGYGYCVELDTGNGTTVLYGHAAKLLVQEGQTVKVGEEIGLTGNTGYSFGPRLHFEIQQGGKAINAVSFLQAQGVDLPNHLQAVGG